MYWYLLAKNWFEAKVAEEKGQDLVEYALIIALVSIALVVALQALTGGISGVFNTIVDKFNVGS
jgi:pilus assembly protein Flp/PilA